MSAGPRRRIARGIYLDRSGYEAHVCVRGQRDSQRFPPGHDLKKIKDWRRDRERELDESVPAKALRGSLTSEVDRYIAKVQSTLPSWVEVRSHLRAWIALYGDEPRWRLTRDHVLEARTAWLRSGGRDRDDEPKPPASPKTINHRVDALAAMYRFLDGKRAPTPCDDVEPLPVPVEPPRPIPAATIRKVVKALELRERDDKRTNAKKRARLMVLAACGVRPSELMRAKPGDVDLKKRWWRTRDGKGGFRPGGLPLTGDMVAAWKVFIAADAWGKYSTRDMAEQLREVGWPEDRRPYELRHSFGQALDEHGTDLADTSALLGHSRIMTSRTHYVGVRRERLRKVVDQLEGRFGWSVRDSRTGRHVKR